MSKADELFKKMCQEIIDNGYSTEGEKVRPHWEDGTPAHTIKTFGVVNRYDLSEEFPALTLRPTGIKSAVDEMLWIWQKKSNNIHDLKSHIWDSWADENGSIGKAYGYQQAKMYLYKGINENDLKKAFEDIETGEINYEGTLCTAYGLGKTECKNGLSEFDHLIAVKNKGLHLMTQIDKAIYDIINNPYSRRIMVTMWNVEDLHEMALEPCAYSMTFNVTGDKLNAILNQRSQDILAANNWNVVQYSMLLMMLAQVTGYKPGILMHVISDAHIYDRHVPIIKELIERPTYPAPKVTLNPDVKNFYDFTPDDVKVEDYQAGPQVKGIPVAI